MELANQRATDRAPKLESLDTLRLPSTCWCRRVSTGGRGTGHLAGLGSGLLGEAVLLIARSLEVLEVQLVQKLRPAPPRPAPPRSLTSRATHRRFSTSFIIVSGPLASVMIAPRSATLPPACCQGAAGHA